MPKTIIARLGVLWLLLMFCAGGAHAALGDELLFHSDLLSLVTYLSVVAILLAVGVLPLLAAGCWLPAWIKDWFWNLAVTGLLVGILLVFLRSLAGFWRQDSFLSELTIGCAAAAAMIGVVAAFRADVRARTLHLGYLGWACILLAPLAVAWNHASARGSASRGPGRQFVMLILDAFPAQYLHTYNPQMPAGSLDALLAEARVFRNVQTAIPYTHGYFGQFYSGRDTMLERDEGFARIRYAGGATGNLLKVLQQARVGARWISFHRNGFPEGSAAFTSDYRGLRSYFLTEHYTWLPQWLGCAYHVALASDSCRKCLKSRVGQRLHRRLNERARTTGNVLVEVALAEARQLRSRSGDSCLIFHVPWTQPLSAADSLPSAQDDDGPGGEPGSVIRKIRERKYRYLADEQPVADAMDRTSRAQVAALGDALRPFLDGLRAESGDTRTTVLLTADHGSMYQKGRFWYGYHPNEEVVRVLCAEFLTDQRGEDERLFTTTDMTASVLDFFGVDANLNPDAQSLFAAGPGRAYTATLTRPTEDEHWLVITEPQVRYWCNLSPSGHGEILAYRNHSYDETPWDPRGVAELRELPRELLPIIEGAMAKYGLAEKDVHPRIRAALRPIRGESPAGVVW